MLYKYRSLNNFKYFVDIILNNRLYASPYFDLNDPMEGYYLYPNGKYSDSILKKIKGKKEKIRICSLTCYENNELMWAHYADGNRGVVIGVEIDKNKNNIRPIIYDGLSSINSLNSNNFFSTAIDILSHKLPVWEYEGEVRIFTNNKNYVDAKVKKIIIGQRMNTRDISIIKNLINKINSEISIEFQKTKFNA